MITTSRRAVLYARFSSENQRSESIDAQVRAMKAYCEHNRITIVDIYIDEAKSATTAQRPAFQKMIEDSKLKTFDIVLVHKLDRFSRNRYDSAVYKRELRRNGVKVYSVLENLDSSPESIMMESVLEGMSEYYSQNLAREVMKGLKENALQCKHNGGYPPLGYDIDAATRKLIINENEAKAVRIIFEMYASGKGYSEILDVLYQKQYKTKLGNNFLKNSLYGILTNPKYKGVYIFNKSSSKKADGTRNSHQFKDSEDIIVIQGGCPPLVDEATFAKVQKRMEANKHHGGRYNAKRVYLLSGKVFCRECGKAMVVSARHCGKTGKLYITYRCPTKRYGCANREINSGYLEHYVIDLLEREIFNVPAINRLANEIKNKQSQDKTSSITEEERIAAQIDETNRAIANITEAIMKGQRHESLLDKLVELEEKKAALETSMLKCGSTEEVDKLAEEKIIDSKLIPEEYVKVKDDVFSTSYKLFVQDFIDKIDVGKYSVDVTIKTGLDIIPELDKKVTVKRQEIYKGIIRP